MPVSETVTKSRSEMNAKDCTRPFLTVSTWLENRYSNETTLGGYESKFLGCTDVDTELVSKIITKPLSRTTNRSFSGVLDSGLTYGTVLESSESKFLGCSHWVHVSRKGTRDHS